MNFELGKEYIVSVSEKGIIPLMVFDKDRWFDKDSDDLDFLTDEEKAIIAKEVADNIRAEILGYEYTGFELGGFKDGFDTAMVKVLNIIDNYRG